MDERPTLRTRLNVARLERFVGREHEIKQFRSTLSSVVEPFCPAIIRFNITWAGIRANR